jgi:hypothetical protein
MTLVPITPAMPPTTSLAGSGTTGSTAGAVDGCGGDGGGGRGGQAGFLKSIDASIPFAREPTFPISEILATSANPGPEDGTSTLRLRFEGSLVTHKFAFCKVKRREQVALRF